MKRVWALGAMSLCLIGASAYAAADPEVGNWKLDLSRSKYVSAKAPKTSEAIVTAYGDGVSVSVHAVTADGQDTHIKYAAHYDGKPAPRTEDGPGTLTGVTVTLKKISPRVVERVVYQGGKAVGTERWTISKDGKTRSVKQSGIDAHGKKIDNTQVYVRE
jgi:hypothetical protein